MKSVSKKLDELGITSTRINSIKKLYYATMPNISLAEFVVRIESLKK